MEYSFTTPREREVTVLTSKTLTLSKVVFVKFSDTENHTYIQALLETGEVDELITALLFARQQTTGVAYELP